MSAEDFWHPELDSGSINANQTDRSRVKHGMTNILFAKQTKMNSSRFTHHPSHKCAAFTLAEVLITLGIIGVVAALTMPTLINSYKAQVLRTQFLQANTIIHDGMQKAYLDSADMAQVMRDRDYTTLFKYFKSGDCELPADEVEAGYYNYYGELKAAAAASSDLVYSHCLANGMTLWLGTINIRSDGSWGDSDYSLLAIDINGWKNKPNRYGKDVFFWFYNSNTGKLIPFGKDTTKLFSEELLPEGFFWFANCPGNKAYSEAGIGCTGDALSDPNYFKK